MEKINEIKIPEGVNRIAVKRYDDKIVIEFIPKEPKFKIGDKVRIKDGISSKTHRYVTPCFASEMDEFIGKELTVEGYRNGFVLLNEDYYKCFFIEDWLEPYTEEPKKGDLAIFWDNECSNHMIRLYHAKSQSGGSYCDNFGTVWDNAVKWDGTKEQFEKVLRGEIN